jgi:hypothetical protein
MKTDRIFVLLLVVMLPLSGCFDDAVGDAEGSEGGENIVNNFYNNTTTNIISESPDMVAIGGYITGVGTGDSYIRTEVASINTSSGQMLGYYETDIEVNPVIWSSFLSIETTCSNGAFWNSGFASQTGQAMYLPGSAFECNHVILTNAAVASNVSWSVVYGIFPVVVG